MKTIPFLFAIVMCISTYHSFAQTELPPLVRKAELSFVEYDYFDALETFQKANEKHPENHFVLRRIADCYRLMGLLDDAKKAYLAVLNVGGYDAMDYYFCSQVHQQLEEYETAQFYIAQFNQMAPDDHRARLALENPEYYAALTSDNPSFSASPLEVNKGMSYLPPADGKELLVLPIAYTDEDAWFPHRRYLADFDLYEANIDKNFNLVSADAMLGKVNTKFSEGPSCYDEQRGILYVTRFLSRKGQPSIDERGAVFSVIASYQETEGEWYETNHFNHDFGMYSCAYPTLSPDGNTLYFSANGEASKGGMDIYTCTWNNGEWSEPMPLHGEINTEGDEIYPNFSKTGGFSFASDGHPGLGGLDIFLVNEEGQISNPGMPVNSPNDDFGLVYIEGEYGYFCSNRATERKGDDLFWWEEMQDVIETEIVLMDLEGNPLYPGKIEVKNLATNEIARTSGQRGSFFATLNGKDTYEFTWNIDGQEMVMRGRPNLSPVGLRYIYSSPHDGVFLADARVVSYKQGNIRNKKVPHDEWNSKNLTNNAGYALNQSEAPYSYLQAQWNSNEENAPVAGSTAYLKDMETGQVHELRFNGNKLEFPVIPDHLHAISWENGQGEEQVKFLAMDTALGTLSCLDETQDWSLALHTTPTMETTDTVVFPDMVASSDAGFATAEPSGYDALVTSSRKFKTAAGRLMISAETVYFGFDKSHVTTAEEAKLQKMIDQLETFPEITLDIVAFTDSRGSSSYNMRLSKKRAEATRKALIDMGFDPSKVTVRWAGEDDLINDCGDGVPCPEQLHLLNRRAEINLVLPQM